MRNRFTRREFGGLLASGAAAAALTASGGLANAESRLRFIWWGNPDRDKRTIAAIDLYGKKHPDITIAPESYAWADYWPKLATQAAGQNLADIIQMDYRYIFEWARRGQLADLTQFLDKTLNLGNFDKNQLDSGKVDGKLYGISLGANSVAFVYNKTKYDALKIALPDPLTWTYDDFAKLAKDVQPHLDKGLYFTANNGDEEAGLEMYVRQRGKSPYTVDGKLGHDADDVAASGNFWDGMQKDGVTPPPDVQALDASGAIEKMMIVNNAAITDWTNSNQLVGIQKLTKDTVDLTLLPNQAGNKPGQYFKPSMFISMAAKSPMPTDCATFLDFMVNDLDAADILQIERGVGGNPAVLEHLKPKLGAVEQRIIGYLQLLAKHVGPLPPPPPKGAGEIQNEIRTAYQAIS